MIRIDKKLEFVRKSYTCQYKAIILNALKNIITESFRIFQLIPLFDIKR